MSSREKLIESTLELLGLHGYRGTTTKAIAEHAGLSEVTLFRQFGSKAELVTAALKLASQPFVDAVSEATDGLEADLISLAEGYVEFVDAWPALIDRVLPEIAGESDIDHSARRIIADNVTATVALIEHHQAEGRLGDTPAAEVVRAFVGPLMARASLRNLLPPASFDAESYVERFLAGYVP